MKDQRSLYHLAEKTSFQVCAHIASRLLHRDIDAEMDRLANQPRSRSYLEVGSVLALLFLLAVAAANFGFWGLFIYFSVILVVFR